MNLKRRAGVIFGMMMILSSGVYSQQNTDSGYVRTINERAKKIVDKIALTEQWKKDSLQSFIARQYFDLNDIDVLRDSSLKRIKSMNLLKEAVTDSVNKIRAAADLQTYQLHYAYTAKLQAVLTPQQTDAVKDGMTYGVLPLTYNAYMQMLPSLTQQQKNQIMTWLIEAREHAMDGGSSKEKHAWFGKYKGRINIYLSKSGIDMKKAEADWMERIKAQKQIKK